MHPSFEQFVAALRDPALRGAIGLSIPDADASALLTRLDWANDYYYKWLAMFPAAAAAAAAAPAAERAPDPVSMSAFDLSPAASPATPPAAAPVDLAASAPAAGSGRYGAPPQTSTPASLHTAPDTWQVGPAASRIPSRAKVPLIVGGSLVGVVLLLVLAVNVFSGVITGFATRTPISAASHGPSTGASGSASDPATDTADDVPADTHGLTPREYRLMEVVVEAQNSTIPILVSNGMSDARLRTLTDQLLVQSDQGCTDSSKVSGGFENATFRASFIAGYMSTTHSTPEVAGTVFDALAVYCTSA